MSEKYDVKAMYDGYNTGRASERNRIINLLLDLDVIRRADFGKLVAFNTDGTEVVYLTGLEVDSKPTETETTCHCKKQP